MEGLRGGSLRVWLSAQDMVRFGLEFQSLSADNAPTRAAVTKLLEVAGKRTPLVGEGLTVEAVPVADGCVLLFTPHRRLPPPRMPLPQLFSLQSADDLLDFGRALRGVSELPAASLYGWGDTYRLVVYAGIGAPGAIRRLLSEYAIRLGEGTALAAFTEEHGTPIAVGDALSLIACEFPPPTPPHPGR